MPPEIAPKTPNRSRANRFPANTARRSGLRPSLPVPQQSVIRADRYADSAAVWLVPVFQSLEIMLRTSSKAWKTSAVALRSLDGLCRDRPCIGRALRILFNQPPQDCTPTANSLAPTRPQIGMLPAQSQEACRFAFRRSRRREDPRHFPSAVSLCRPFASACPPCRLTLLQALTPSALSCACACARPLRFCLLPPS